MERTTSEPIEARYACCQHCGSEARDPNGKRRIGHHFPCPFGRTQWGPTCVDVPFHSTTYIRTTNDDGSN